jgi:hypothetical protein
MSTEKKLKPRMLIATILTVVAGIASVKIIRFYVGGEIFIDHQFSFERLLAMPGNIPRLFIHSGNNLYTIALLLPLGIAGIYACKPAKWFLAATVSMGIMVVLMGAYADIVGVNRPLLNVCGPFLAISSATMLDRLICKSKMYFTRVKK